MHRSYEELCALAATGQITGEAMRVLDQHLKECSDCRAFLQDLVPLKTHVTPVVAGSRTRSGAAPYGIRERFLQRAAAAGLKLNPGPAVEVAESTPSPFTQPQKVGSNGFLNWFITPRFAVPALACMLCAVLGFAIARFTAKSKPTQTVIASPLQPSGTAMNQDSAQIARLQQQNEYVTRRAAALSADLARVRAKRKRLEQELASLAQRGADGDQFQERFKEVSAELEAAKARAAKVQSDLDSERNRATTAEAVSLAQQKATEDANSKVATLESQIDRLRQLDSSESIARDLISARNLHIVDVYDTEANGERKRAFGRVFFVEGRSLVFFAYDLPIPHHGNKKVEFQVWGEQAGVDSVTINLGAMRSDNSSEERWVLSCDDPKILNRINAVYLTADTNPRADSKPRGAKLLYGFLGSPNHP